MKTREEKVNEMIGKTFGDIENGKIIISFKGEVGEVKVICKNRRQVLYTLKRYRKDEYGIMEWVNVVTIVNPYKGYVKVNGSWKMRQRIIETKITKKKVQSQELTVNETATIEEGYLTDSFGFKVKAGDYYIDKFGFYVNREEEERLIRAEIEAKYEEQIEELKAAIKEVESRAEEAENKLREMKDQEPEHSSEKPEEPEDPEPETPEPAETAIKIEETPKKTLILNGADIKEIADNGKTKIYKLIRGRKEKQEIKKENSKRFDKWIQAGDYEVNWTRKAYKFKGGTVKSFGSILYMISRIIKSQKQQTLQFNPQRFSEEPKPEKPERTTIDQLESTINEIKKQNKRKYKGVAIKDIEEMIVTMKNQHKYHDISDKITIINRNGKTEFIQESYYPECIGRLYKF